MKTNDKSDIDSKIEYLRNSYSKLTENIKSNYSSDKPKQDNVKEDVVDAEYEEEKDKK